MDNSNEPLVAILMPSKNSLPFLANCLLTLQNQTYKRFRLYIVDDSTDGSADLIQTTAQTDSRIIFSSQQEKGLAAARNQCLEMALKDCPDLLTFVDSDDYLDGDYLEKMIEMATKWDADIVSSSFFEVKGEAKWRYAVQKNRPDALYLRFTATKMLLEDRYIISHLHSKIFRAGLWNDIRFPKNINYCEDRATCFRPFVKSTRVINTSYAGYYYREDNNTSLCAEPWHAEKILSTYRAYIIQTLFAYEGFSDEQKKELISAAYSALFRLHLSLFPRFDFTGATPYERDEMKRILSLIHKNRAWNHFLPVGAKERCKKLIYRLQPQIYRFAFRKICKIR